MLEGAMTPSSRSGNRHAAPEATLKTPAELIPQVERFPATGHSDAARAAGGATLGTARITAAAIVTFDTRMNLSYGVSRSSRGWRSAVAALTWIKQVLGAARASARAAAGRLFPCHSFCARATILCLGAKKGGNACLAVSYRSRSCRSSLAWPQRPFWH